MRRSRPRPTARPSRRWHKKAEPQFDPTIPGTAFRVGRLHPITQTIEELKDIMGRLGFSVADGPEVEDEWHNFEALNIPREHPARDPLDNFYLATAGKATGAGTALLRSQTSTVQIRVMEKTPPPIRIISLGRVYRPDTADATHYPMFHQMEGLLIDTRVTMADLKSVLRLFATSYLGRDVHIRFRPSFFPFTEPSVEADFHWDGQWIEFGGAGMVDPNVLRAVGYDPEKYVGFAFGLGSRTAVYAPPRDHGHPRVLQERRAVPPPVLTRKVSGAFSLKRFLTPFSGPDMLVSWNWLKDYVALKMSPDELVERLSMAGLNHEESRPVGDDLQIDLEVTSNRPDCLGHIGVAREMSVLWQTVCACRRRSPPPRGRR